MNIPNYNLCIHLDNFVHYYKVPGIPGHNLWDTISEIQWGKLLTTLGIMPTDLGKTIE